MAELNGAGSMRMSLEMEVGVQVLMALGVQAQGGKGIAEGFVRTQKERMG